MMFWGCVGKISLTRFRIRGALRRFFLGGMEKGKRWEGGGLEIDD